MTKKKTTKKKTTSLGAGVRADLVLSAIARMYDVHHVLSDIVIEARKTGVDDATVQIMARLVSSLTEAGRGLADAGFDPFEIASAYKDAQDRGTAGWDRRVDELAHAFALAYATPLEKSA